MYRPKVIKGRVRNTGWPIDGHELYFTQWDYDNHDSWHLAAYDKDEAREEALMLTMYQTEVEAGLDYTLEEFREMWKAGTWEPDGVFCLELDQVEVLEVLQEEQKV